MKDSNPISIKICGITRIDQATAIADLGADAIGVIGVKSSARFVDENKRRNLFDEIRNSNKKTDRVWVTANLNDNEINKAINGKGTPTIIQLHGKESKERCSKLKQRYPEIKWWKAIQIHSYEDIKKINDYSGAIDAVLLDSWKSNQLGGTGMQIPTEWLINAEINIPWWIAGGICKEWVDNYLGRIKPTGLDASSRLEKSPGVKDLSKVNDLIKAIREIKMHQ